MAAISSLASYDKLQLNNQSSHSLSSNPSSSKSASASSSSSSDRTRHRSKSPANNMSSQAQGQSQTNKKPILRLVIIKNAYHQVLTIASDLGTSAAAGAASLLAPQVYSWSAPSHTLTANPNSHFSILRYQAHQPPIPLYAPESGVQVLFRFGSPPKYVGTEQDGILRAVNNPNSFCIWTMQAFEGGFFSLTHPTKRVLIVKDASLALAPVDGAGWEKMFKMEVAPLPPGAAATAATGPRSNSPPKSSPRFAPSTGSSPSKQQQQPPRASIATSVATPEPSTFNNRPDAPPVPRIPSNPQLRPPQPGQQQPPSVQQDRPGSYAPPPQIGGYVPPQRPQMQQQGPPPPSQQQQQQGGPGQRPMSLDSVASYNNNGPPGAAGSGGMQSRPPMMQGGPGGPPNNGPRPPMMQGGPGGPPGGPRPPMMQGGPSGPPRPPMPGGPPPGTSGPGAPAPPGGTAMLSTPISFTDIRAHFIQRSPSSPNKFIMHKLDTRTDAHLAMYFTLHLAVPEGPNGGGVRTGGAVDLNAAHRAKVLVQCCDTEQFLGAANKDLVEMSKPTSDACTWEFLKLPHNPLAFALAHPATNCVLAASGSGKSARHMTLVPHATKPKDTQSSFLLYIPASLSAAVQQQQVAGQERPWIQKAMPWIQAAGAVGGIATAGALVANIMITNAKTSAPAGGAGTQGTTPVNAGRMEDGSANANGGVQAQHMQDGSASGMPSDIQLGGGAASEQVMLADGPLPDMIPAAAATQVDPAQQAQAQAQPDTLDAGATPATATDASGSMDFAPLDTSALDAAFTHLDQVDATGFDVGGGLTQADVDAMVHDFAHADLAAAGAGVDGADDVVGLEEFGLHVGEDGAVHHVGVDGGDDGGD